MQPGPVLDSGPATRAAAASRRVLASARVSRAPGFIRAESLVSMAMPAETITSETLQRTVLSFLPGVTQGRAHMRGVQAVADDCYSTDGRPTVTTDPQIFAFWQEI